MPAKPPAPPRPPRAKGSDASGGGGGKRTGPKAASSSKRIAPKAPSSGERIAKVLARAGLASRRDAEEMVLEGRVAVNGRKLDSPATSVTPTDRITVDGQPLPEPERARLWLYHKPAGLVTTARDEQGRPTVFDQLPPELPRVMPVGRLDLTSEGLLLLTNDGELKRRLELPSTGWLRKYRVRVHGTPTDEQLAPLKAGIVIEGERFQPMIVALDRQQGANAWLTVGLREGRNREIRRAMEAVGLTVNRLIRTGYGPFQLGSLAPGAVEEVRARVLRDQLGLPAPTDEGAAPRPAGGAKPAASPPAAGPGGGGGAKPGSQPRPKPVPKSWGLKSHGGAGRSPARQTGDDEAAPAGARPGPRSWGQRSHAGARVEAPRRPPGPGRKPPAPGGGPSAPPGPGGRGPRPPRG